MAEVFNPLIYGHPVLDYNFRTLSRILNNITTGEGIPTTRITDDAIDGTKIADASVDTEHLVADAVTAAKIEALTITAAEIAAGTITANEIASNAITSVKILADAVTATKIDVVGLDGASGRIIVADATDANVVTDGINTYAATLIAPGKVLISGSTNLDDWSHGSDATMIDGGDIYADSVTATQISVTQLDALSANVGTLTAGTITSGVSLGANWRKIYDTDITTKCTSVTLSGLSGNTDKEYLILYRWIDDDAEASFGIRPNNASGASAYGWEDVYITGSGANAVCFQDTSFSYIYAGRATPGHISQGYTRLWAETGYPRTSFGTYTRSVNGTTILGLYVLASTWNETSTEITSLVFFADQTEEMAPGTHIEVWKRVD